MMLVAIYYGVMMGALGAGLFVLQRVGVLTKREFIGLLVIIGATLGGIFFLASKDVALQMYFELRFVE